MDWRRTHEDWMIYFTAAQQEVLDDVCFCGHKKRFHGWWEKGKFVSDDCRMQYCRCYNFTKSVDNFVWTLPFRVIQSITPAQSQLYGPKFGVLHVDEGTSKLRSMLPYGLCKMELKYPTIVEGRRLFHPAAKWCRRCLFFVDQRPYAPQFHELLEKVHGWHRTRKLSELA